MLIAAAPVKFKVGVNCTASVPAKVALIAVIVPVRVTVPVPLPAIPLPSKPLVTLLATLRVPFVEVRVTVREVSPASTSATLKPSIVTAVSSAVVLVAFAIVLAGASLISTSEIVTALAADAVAEPSPSASVAVTVNA